MREDFLDLFPQSVWHIWEALCTMTPQIREIRIRKGKPIMVLKEDGEWFLKKDGLTKEVDLAISIAETEFHKYVNHICKDSLYAFQEELKNGYITVRGGHRIGVAGQVMVGQGDVVGMKYISCLNIRLAHQIIGAANRVLPFVYEKGAFINTLIISPPGCGKTTLLRDMVRQISNGNAYGEGVAVSVVDERSEIAGCYLGVPQNDVGIRTDVLDSCPKAQGMMMMLRSMSPKVVAVDELGGRMEEDALFKLSYCGCRVLATVHGESVEELTNKEGWQYVMSSHLFERYLLLGKVNGRLEILQIYDREMKEL